MTVDITDFVSFHQYLLYPLNYRRRGAACVMLAMDSLGKIMGVRWKYPATISGRRWCVAYAPLKARTCIIFGFFLFSLTCFCCRDIDTSWLLVRKEQVRCLFSQLQRRMEFFEGQPSSCQMHFNHLLKKHVNIIVIEYTKHTARRKSFVDHRKY